MSKKIFLPRSQSDKNTGGLNRVGKTLEQGEATLTTLVRVSANHCDLLIWVRDVLR